MFLRILGQNILIVSSARRVQELFDQRASLYSGRPHMIMFNELCVKTLPILPSF